MSDTPRPQRFFNRHEVAAIVAMHAHQECNKLIVIVVAEKDAASGEFTGMRVYFEPEAKEPR